MTEGIRKREEFPIVIKNNLGAESKVGVTLQLALKMENGCDVSRESIAII